MKCLVFFFFPETEQQVSEEERGNTSSTSCSLESLEKPSTQVCQLFSNFHHLKLRNSELHRFLQVFIKCAKILKPLEMSVIHVLRDFFEEGIFNDISFINPLEKDKDAL